MATRTYLAFFAATLILPILAFASLVFWLYGVGERTRLENTALQDAREIAQGVDALLGDLISSAQILALVPTLRQGSLADIYRLTQDMSRTLDIQATVSAADGQELVNPLAILGAPLPKMSLPTDQMVIRTRRPYVSDLFIGAIDQTPLFAVIVPVFREDGQTIYLLDLRFPVSRLKGMLSPREQRPAHRRAAIVDRAGIIMAHDPRHEDFVTKPAPPDLLENTKDRAGTWVGVASDGHPIFAAYARPQLADWRIVIGLKQTALTAPLRRSLGWLAAIGVGLLTASGVLAWVFGARFSASIRALAANAAAVGQGEVVSSIQTSNREVWRVGEALVRASVDLHERDAALRESEERLRLAILAGRMGVWQHDLKADTIVASPELNQLLGLPADAASGSDELWSRYIPGERERIRAQIDCALSRGERSVELEMRCTWPDGQSRWHLLRATIFVAPDGTPSTVTGVVVDITERKRWEEHQQLLINELNHRVKNTLATVQSIATQTLRHATTSQEAKEALEVRLLALSRAHNVLTREHWEGADLNEIVAEAVAPYSAVGATRLHIVGPSVRLSPRMALSLALVLHELATNAVKYGALSGDTGEVRIAWWLSQDDGESQLHLTWVESAGMPVPTLTRRGFGTRLVERSVTGELKGVARFDFRPEGLVCAIDVPMQ